MTTSVIINILVIFLGLVSVAAGDEALVNQNGDGHHSSRTLQFRVSCNRCLSRGCMAESVGRVRKTICDGWGCNLLNCEAKQCTKCVKKDCFSLGPNYVEKRCIKLGCALRQDCEDDEPQLIPEPPTPTPPPTPVPTPRPTPRPTPGAAMKVGTGKVCSSGEKCISGTCRNGVCMASSDCYPLKHKHGVPFDENKINLVFVASAFTNRNDWRSQVKTTFSSFTSYNMFAKNVEQFNAFYVDPSNLDPSFCTPRCKGNPALLCCDTSKARGLANKCFPSQETLQTIVVHNDFIYGGAGYKSSNVATTSRNSLGPRVAIHELGHSLFELADEYSNGKGTPDRPNCSASTSCTKWKDLIGRTPPGYTDVRCVRGCQGNGYYVGELSFMQALHKPVGAVNERFTCCTYLALTNSMPSYCNAFNFGNNYLLNYCRNNDYQKYGYNSYSVAPSRGLRALAATSDESAKYIHVEHPLLLMIGFQDDGEPQQLGEPQSAPSGLFLKRKVMGDYSNVSEASEQGEHVLVRVRVVYSQGTEAVLFFSENDSIEVPPIPDGGIFQHHPAPHRVSEHTDLLEVVLGLPEGDDVIENIEVTTMDLPR